MWQFMEDDLRQRGLGEPVAVKTVLGWVLSGSLSGMTLNSFVESSVNFVSSHVVFGLNC